ncbi:uncharacterized protein [Amphiura filiformis]|uniref:uncharacterized protein isoform X2 n=1 Tax=Amphiura filiformis TaxID=82378 RepID=UPI003B20DA66
MDLLGAIGGEDGGGNEDAAEEARLIEEARQEQEAERKAKHEKMEEEREKERQRIRDKYGLKKKEELQMGLPEPGADGRISRKKKTPEEMKAEMDAGDEEEGIFDTVLSYLTPITDKLGINLNK